MSDNTKLSIMSMHWDRKVCLLSGVERFPLLGGFINKGSTVSHTFLFGTVVKRFLLGSLSYFSEHSLDNSAPHTSTHAICP